MNIKEKRIASWLLVVTRTKTEKRRWTPGSCNSLFAVVLADTTNVGHFPVYKKEKIYIDIYIYHASDGVGERCGVHWKRLKKTCFYVLFSLFFPFLIVISIGPFFPIIHKVYSGPYFLYIFLFLRIIHRIPSHLMLLKGLTCPCPLALSYWRHWWLDWPQLMAIPPNYVGCSRILKGTACHSALLLGAGA